MFFVLITLCSCDSVIPGNEDIRDRLKERFPEADVRYDNGYYNVITDNVPLADYDTVPEYGLVEAEHYETTEELLGQLEPTTSIVIRGKMTGDTRQCVTYDADDGYQGMQSTDAKIKVLDAYYGDVSVGDEIVFRQDYATHTSSDGTRWTYNFACVPLNRESEYLLVLRGYNESFYEGMTAFRSIDSYSREIDVSMLQYMSNKGELYEKYVENKDTALDKAYEAKKLLERKQMLAERGVYVKSGRKNNKIYKQVTELLEQYPCSYDILKTGLSPKETELIERLIQKYGEK